MRYMTMKKSTFSNGGGGDNGQDESCSNEDESFPLGTLAELRSNGQP